MKAQISPSLLAANIGRIDDELEAIGNADWIHVDVMDNHFVPNLSWGLPVAQACVEAGTVPVDAHLMIEDPDRWAPQYAEAGCKNVTFHAEAATAPTTVARTLRSLGSRAGIAFRPATSVEPYLPILGEFDMVLIMTVEPGFGGQTFLQPMLEKIRKVREAADAAGLDLDIQVDGGIDRETIAAAAAAGANNFVAGSSIYGTADPAAEIDALREIVDAL